MRNETTPLWLSALELGTTSYRGATHIQPKMMLEDFACRTGQPEPTCTLLMMVSQAPVLTAPDFGDDGGSGGRAAAIVTSGDEPARR